ncbi:hypothetical protein Hanom_Chr15g01362191 [Helianthus anomalus]
MYPAAIEYTRYKHNTKISQRLKTRVITLKTGPKPPSPILLESLKLFVAIFSCFKENEIVLSSIPSKSVQKKNFASATS